MNKWAFPSSGKGDGPFTLKRLLSRTKLIQDINKANTKTIHTNINNIFNSNTGTRATKHSASFDEVCYKYVRPQQNIAGRQDNRWLTKKKKETRGPLQSMSECVTVSNVEYNSIYLNKTM